MTCILEPWPCTSYWRCVPGSGSAKLTITFICFYCLSSADSWQSIAKGYTNNNWYTNYPCNTDQTILFYNGFPTFDFSLFSVVDFEQLKSNWNNIRKTFIQLLKNLKFHNEKQPFWNVGNTFFNSCCVTRVRILAIHGAKITKNHTPLVCFAWLWFGRKIIKQNVPGGYDF